ncbi:MAG: hypothetical protein V3V45_08765 [Candidatus Brocadiales bacterium]
MQRADVPSGRGFKGFSIRGRLLLFSLCISLIPITIITTLGYLHARMTLREEALDWLTAVAESRMAHVLEILEVKNKQAVNFSSDGFIRDSLEIISGGGLVMKKPLPA